MALNARQNPEQQARIDAWKKAEQAYEDACEQVTWTCDVDKKTTDNLNTLYENMVEHQAWTMYVTCRGDEIICVEANPIVADVIVERHLGLNLNETCSQCGDLAVTELMTDARELPDTTCETISHQQVISMLETDRLDV